MYSLVLAISITFLSNRLAKEGMSPDAISSKVVPPSFEPDNTNLEGSLSGASFADVNANFDTTSIQIYTQDLEGNFDLDPIEVALILTT